MPEKKFTVETFTTAEGKREERRVDLKTGQTYYTSEEDEDREERARKKQACTDQKREEPTATSAEAAAKMAKENSDQIPKTTNESASAPEAVSDNNKDNEKVKKK